jgi:hypothetical protein
LPAWYFLFWPQVKDLPEYLTIFSILQRGYSRCSLTVAPDFKLLSMILYGKRLSRVFIAQLLITFVSLMGIGIVSTILDGDWDFYVPVRASLVILVTLVICLLIGLPIRFNTKINTWWRRHPFVPLTGIIIGVVLLYLSQLRAFTEVESYYDIVQVRNNPYMSITGWFLTAFCLVHMYKKKGAV